jgi:actin-related protein
LFSPQHFKDAISEVLFEKFKVPSVAFVPTEALCLTTLNNRSFGLIIDSGYSETRVLPVSFTVMKQSFCPLLQGI